MCVWLMVGYLYNSVVGGCGFQIPPIPLIHTYSTEWKAQLKMPPKDTRTKTEVFILTAMLPLNYMRVDIQNSSVSTHFFNLIKLFWFCMCRM